MPKGILICDFVHFDYYHLEKDAELTSFTIDELEHNLSYILGNPPFVGARVMEKEQSAELAMLFSGVKNAGNLDYVTGWYKKAAEYIQGTQIECAFVSTNGCRFRNGHRK